MPKRTHSSLSESSLLHHKFLRNPVKTVDFTNCHFDRREKSFSCRAGPETPPAPLEMARIGDSSLQKPGSRSLIVLRLRLLYRVAPQSSFTRAAHHESISICGMVSTSDPARETLSSAASLGSPKASSTETASIAVRPIPPAQWINTASPACNRLAMSLAKAQNALRSSGTPPSRISNDSTGQGTLPVSRASA